MTTSDSDVYRTRYSRRMSDEHLAANVRGLMLAFCLSPEAVALLLGSTIDEANAYRAEALGRFYGLKARAAQARNART